MDDCPLCHITHYSKPVKLIFSGKHRATNFYLFKSAEHPLILGFTWLKCHNPHTDLSSGRALGWGNECIKTFFPQSTASVLPKPVSPPHGLSAVPASPESDYPDIFKVPQCYHDLKEVFNKSNTTSLPPHHEYDFFAIPFYLVVLFPKEGFTLS